MFRCNFDRSTWGRFHALACVACLVDLYATQPTCWSLSHQKESTLALEASPPRDARHCPQTEHAHKNFRHAKPISDPPKRQDHRVNSKRHVLPHVLSTDCCGESTNAATTLLSRSLAFRCGELVTSQNNSKNIMFTGRILGIFFFQLRCCLRAPPRPCHHFLFLFHFWFWIHTTSTPSTAGTHTDGGAIIR